MERNDGLIDFLSNRDDPEMPSTVSSASATLRDSRAVVIIATIAFALATYIAWNQDPFPDAHNPPKALVSAAWWLHPLERNPQMRLPYIEGDLYTISAPKGTDHVWITDQDKFLIHSPDAGKTWESFTIPDTPGPPERVTSQADANLRSLPDVRAASLIFPMFALMAAEEKKEPTPEEKGSGPPNDPIENLKESVGTQADEFLKQVESGDPTGNPGNDNGGLLDVPEQISRDLFVTSIHFVNRTHGWVAAFNEETENAYLYRTTDAGDSWIQSAPREGGWLLGLLFFGETTGVVVDDELGTFLRTENGGESWRATYEVPGADLIDSLGLAGNDTLRGVGDEGAVFRSQDMGRSWETIATIDVGSAYIEGAYFLDENRGWATTVDEISPEDNRQSAEEYKDENGVFRTVDGGITWEWSRVGSPGAMWSSIYFADEKHGWVTSGKGIYRSNDGGANWQLQVPVFEQHDLTGLTFSTPNIGWAIGADIILRTIDGGESWHKINRSEDAAGTYSIFFPPWYFVALLLTGGTAVRATRRRRSGKFVKAPEPDNADGESPQGTTAYGAATFQSDAAIDSKAYDRLNFGPLVERMSQFLRNQSTQRGLTMAITGGWGSGKTSFMNLLKRDLKENGYRPVYFNAWHHQHEEMLLLSVLEAIRHDAVKPIWTLEGFDFWMRLVWVRFTRSHYWPVVVALLVIFGFSLSHFVTNEGAADDAMRVVSNLRANFNETGAGLLVSPKELTNTVHEYTLYTALEEHGTYLLLGLGSLTILLGFIVKWSQVYGVNPLTNIVALVSKWVRLKDLEGRTQSREQFLLTFKDVARAMRQRRIALFADDLDRCDPKHVVRSLETFNYLSAYGDCYIILGVDWDRLRKSLVKGFEDRFKDETATEEVQNFVDEYMEKLVQVAFAIPERSSEEKATLLDSAKQKADSATPIRDAFDRAVAWSLNVLAIPICATSLFLFSFIQLDAELNTHRKVLEARASAEKARLEQAEIATDPSIAPTTEPDQSIAEKTASESVGSLTEGQEPRGRITSVAFSALGGLLLLMMLASEFVGRTVRTEKDTDAFADTLKRWSRLIDINHPTPRAHKRFQNQARFIAKLVPAANGAATTSSITDFDREHAAIILTALNLHYRDLDKVTGLLKNPQVLTQPPEKNDYDAEMIEDFTRTQDALNAIEGDFRKLTSRMYLS